MAYILRTSPHKLSLTSLLHITTPRSCPLAQHTLSEMAACRDVWSRPTSFTAWKSEVVVQSATTQPQQVPSIAKGYTRRDLGKAADTSRGEAPAKSSRRSRPTEHHGSRNANLSQQANGNAWSKSRADKKRNNNAWRWARPPQTKQITNAQVSGWEASQHMDDGWGTPTPDLWELRPPDEKPSGWGLYDWDREYSHRHVNAGSSPANSQKGKHDQEPPSAEPQDACHDDWGWGPRDDHNYWVPNDPPPNAKRGKPKRRNKWPKSSEMKARPIAPQFLQVNEGLEDQQNIEGPEWYTRKIPEEMARGWELWEPYSPTDTEERIVEWNDGIEEDADPEETMDWRDWPEIDHYVFTNRPERPDSPANMFRAWDRM